MTIALDAWRTSPILGRIEASKQLFLESPQTDVKVFCIMMSGRTTYLRVSMKLDHHVTLYSNDFVSVFFQCVLL